VVTDTANPAEALGPNEWLVDEMLDKFRADPKSVSETWQEFFADYGTAPTAATRSNAPTPPPNHGSAAAAPATPIVASDTANGNEGPGAPIRGVGAKIAANMEASLEIPTATSFREVPAKLLEVNRSIINDYMSRIRGSKVSFTHLIGYAVVRAIGAVPAMNRSFAEANDGSPRLVTPDHVNLGLAVDVQKRDGSRSLVVPVIRAADSLDFAGFIGAYDELVRKVTSNKLSPDDFAGATATLTNPGTIGTERSVPRLMPGQGVIVGVGSLAYPVGFMAADRKSLASLGISKVMTISSTYDHRIIQGAESGLFLKEVESLLLGNNDFYVEVFRSLGVPHTPVRWSTDTNPHDHADGMLRKQMQVANLINMYRVRGNLIADLNPLATEPPKMHPELDPSTYGLSIWDLDREFLSGLEQGVYAPVGGKVTQTLDEILRTLRAAYCQTIGIEYTHISSIEQKRWIQEHVEGVKWGFDGDQKIHILEKLNAAEALEKFLGTKYVGQKRFGLEGAESLIPILDELLQLSADSGLRGAVLGMSHRGRLNVLINIVGKSQEQLFREFEGYIDPDSIQGSGDVKYHLGQSGTFVSRAGNEIPVELAANPSHLEAVDPVVQGMVRAQMDLVPYDHEAKFPILPILMHGDAAFAGQGVVAETLNLSLIKGYRVGGTVHVIVNNQLGFTTDPSAARSSEYCTDVAKTVQAPIFHVNGDDPEACVRVAQLAWQYRQQFHTDVVIDMVCYRRHGHNEGDDPSYTQPLMYRAIEKRRSVRKLYTEALMRRGDIDVDIAEQALQDFQRKLQQSLDSTREQAPDADVRAQRRPPAAGVLRHVETGVEQPVLDEIYDTLMTVPDGFTIHPKLAKQFDARTEMFRGGQVDWALGEAFAIGSLLMEGTSVRIAGQDSRRGTFSQRHSTLVDYQNGAEHLSLRPLAKNGTEFWIYDSLLSEYAALGFEYGYSVANPAALVAWEGQFGDFVNGAQIVIDQFITSAEDKWYQESGLVLLLPHGFEGQGPEHSSGRMERFLTLCAEDNIQVCNASNAAQYFHLLRRQMHRAVRKPLVVFTPKSGLRAKTYRSPVSDFTSGSFEELLGDRHDIDETAVTRLILASGKVAHEAIARRDELGAPVAVARVEQLFPWPFDAVARELARYPNCTEIVWLQEEPENMGPWNTVKGFLYEAHELSHLIQRVSRGASGSPATGKALIHQQEQTELLDRAFKPFDSK
jgi:2-oxoglutarate dehydrogenase E1 component